MATTTAGNTSAPTSAITTSARNIWTTAITIITTVPSAIGNGAIGPHAASTSALALESSWPVGWRWCHSIRRARYCRVTARRVCACIRNCMIPAPSRRATMPTARSSATPMKSAKTATSRSVPISPFSKAGSTTWSVAQPSTQASATVSVPKITLPRVETAKIHGSRLIPTQSTASPAVVVPRRVRSSVTCTPLLRGANPAASPGYSHPSTSGRPPSRSTYARAMTATPDAESLAKRERRELCDLALALGPDAPTLCENWTAADLMAHLVVRERKPIASMGNVVERFSGLNQRAMAKQQTRGFEVLVERYRTPALFLRAVPPIDEAMNGFELLVHHEDLRRGATEWEPRELDDATLDKLWTQLAKGIRFFGRRVPGPTVIRRAGTDDSVTAKKGDDPVTVTGPVVELILFLFGRSEVRGITFDGPADKVEELRSAKLGV